MVQEAYCSFEVSKLLNEKRFDVSCLSTYDINNGKQYFHTSYIMCATRINAPTHQMAMAWLREVHNICITIYPDKENGYEAVLYNIKDDVEIILQSFGIYGYHIFEDSYEEAVEAALLYCLTNLI